MVSERYPFTPAPSPDSGESLLEDWSIGIKVTNQNFKENDNEKKTLPVVIVSTMVFLSLALISCATAPLSKSEKEQQQDSVRDMANKTLSELYIKNPAAKSEISKAAGYAVFSDFGFKVMWQGGAGGSGIAVNNATKQETFMKMVEFQPGLGLGAAKFRLVFIFETPEAFTSFVTSGWEAGANAMASAKTKAEGGALAGAVTVSKGIKMLQLNDEGAIVGVSLTAAKYYKDMDLN
jgi:lipid-binding SYLF domain-containing protein